MYVNNILLGTWQTAKAGKEISFWSRVLEATKVTNLKTGYHMPLVSLKVGLWG